MPPDFESVRFIDQKTFMTLEAPIIISEIDETLIESLQAYLKTNQSDLRVLLHEFYNVFIKSPSQQPRKVHWSSELLDHPLFQNEKNVLIKSIAASIENGNPLTPYLSEKSEQLRQYDISLAHFGVHHMHLGDKLQTKGARKGRVKGTKSLLFVRFVGSNAYLLDILGHDLQEGFLNMHLFRVMYKNWPESIEQFHLKGVIGVAIKYSDAEVLNLIKNDVNVIVEMGRNEVYMLPGMGTTTAGTPLQVEIHADRTIEELQMTVKAVHQHSISVAQWIRRLTKIGYNIIRLKSEIKNGLVYIYDSQSGCVFNMQGDKLIISNPNKV